MYQLHRLHQLSQLYRREWIEKYKKFDFVRYAGATQQSLCIHFRGRTGNKRKTSIDAREDCWASRLGAAIKVIQAGIFAPIWFDNCRQN